MQTFANKTFATLLKGQRRIARAVSGLSLKLKVLGTLSDFDSVARRGRSFARRRGITKEKILQDD